MTTLAHNGLLCNSIDSPGHSGFGGEMERILDVVDILVLLVN